MVKKAAKSAEVRQPESRIIINNFHAVKVQFTEKILFPKGADQDIIGQVNDYRRRLKAGEPSGKSPI